MIDCSHGNSYKDHNKQIDVARSLAEQISQGEESVFGVMIESFIEAGKQAVKAYTPLVYGKSITDACVDLAVSEEILMVLAKAVSTKSTQVNQNDLNNAVDIHRNLQQNQKNTIQLAHFLQQAITGIFN